MNFNPHSHEGSDTAATALLYNPAKISIHTPTKGATDNGYNYGKKTIISIHTPTKGATFLEAPACANWYISIHTPTKGATLAKPVLRVFCALFQSTLPRRERLSYLFTNHKYYKFQSTLPRRERL